MNKTENILTRPKFYVLIDPVDKQVKNVGKTLRKLKVRLTSHMQNKKGNVGMWVQYLKQLGLTPIIHQIGDCDEKDNWEDYEKILISEFKNYGYPLLNLSPGGMCVYNPMQKHNPRGKTKKKNPIKKVICITPDNEQIVYISCADAARNLQLDGTFVSKVARGLYKQYKGYKFKYHE